MDGTVELTTVRAPGLNVVRSAAPAPLPQRSGRSRDPARNQISKLFGLTAVLFS